eukprot:11199877-Lingulodinium_polyedra.AAC.1
MVAVFVCVSLPIWPPARRGPRSGCSVQSLPACPASYLGHRCCPRCCPRPPKTRRQQKRRLAKLR